MTIIHLSSSLGGGGGEKMVLQLAGKSNEQIPTLVISISEVNTLEDKFTQKGIKCHFLNINSFRNRSLFRGLKKLHAAIGGIDDPILHAHQYHGGLLAIIYNLFYRKVPIVFTLHSSTSESKLRRIMLFLTRPWRKKDIIFSANTRQWFLKNSAIIPNGIDFSAYSSEKRRRYQADLPFQFLFLGRISPEKNPFETITLAKALIRRGFEHFQINIVGDGYKCEELLDRIKLNDLGSKIRYHGFQNDVRPFLKTAHCLILLSSREGLPMVIIEAAACKLPIISTAVGSIPEFLNQENSRLTDLAGFPDVMIEVMNAYEKALERSEKLHAELSEKFGIDRVYDRHLQLYKSVMKEPS